MASGPECHSREIHTNEYGKIPMGCQMDIRFVRYPYSLWSSCSRNQLCMFPNNNNTAHETRIFQRPGTVFPCQADLYNTCRIRCYARPHSRHYQNDMAAELSYDGKQSSHRIHMVVGRNTYLVAS